MSIRKREVHLAERIEGPYRICAGALEARQGNGYIAAIVVNRMESESQRGRKAYRYASLACGHRWESPDDALRYAVTRAREIIATQSQMLSC